MSPSNSKNTPWQDGLYIMKGMPTMVFTVMGEDVQYEALVGRTSNHDNDPNFNGSMGNSNLELLVQQKKR